MTRLAEIQRSRASTGELLGIVAAMRSLAAMRLQEAEQALPAMRRYAQAMALGIGTVLQMPSAGLVAPTTGPRAIILCTAEHGFVGAYNERLLDRAHSELGPRDVLFVLGERGAALALERRQRPAWTHPMPTRIAAIPDCVSALVDVLFEHLARGALARADVVVCHATQGRTPSLEQRRLLPIDAQRFTTRQDAQPPLTNLPTAVLLENLIAEYVFAQLTEALADAIAGENSARFTAMEAAHDNVSRKLATLRQAEREARQSEITAELLDLVVGSGALGEGASNDPQGYGPPVASLPPSTGRLTPVM